MPTPPETSASEPDARAGFESLALPYVDHVYRAAYGLTGNPAEAEDLTQDTYLRAFQAYEGYRGGSAKVWLLTILRNAFIDRYRRRRPEPLDIDDDALTHASANGNDVLHAPGAEEQLMSAGLAEEVDRALGALPPEWRLVIVLADLENLSYSEIAAITETPVGTVMSRLHRSRKRLHGALMDFARLAGYTRTMGS